MARIMCSERGAASAHGLYQAVPPRPDRLTDAVVLGASEPAPYGDDFRIFTIPLDGTPEPLGRQPGSFEQFSVDSAGDRVAAGFSNCPRCAGPVTVLSVPSGSLVGRVGGKELDNITPSLSPDGKQIAFQRQGGWLEVVDVATGKVQKLLRLRFTPNVVWSSSSQELLVKTQPLRQNRCASLWRVPAGGGKPQLLRNC